MKKIILTVIALTMTVGAKGQTEVVDTAQFVAVYDYECRTQDYKGQDVTDRMQVVVQVGRLSTKSMPFSNYDQSEESLESKVVTAYQEAYMHIPTVWIGVPTGYTTVREFIFPHEYDSTEETPYIEWTLTEDTMTVSGYHCQKATTTFRGVEWRVYYTEEIPSSAGPWRLNGLPGLIVKAESQAHTFCLSELRQENSSITAPELNPNVQRTKYEKLMKYRNEIFGNSQYAKNPLYYIAEMSGSSSSGWTLSLGSSINHMEVNDLGGKQYLFANGHPLMTTTHVYQPLELE